MSSTESSDAAAAGRSQALSPAQEQALAQASDRARTLQRAGKLAKFNGWSVAACALLSLPLALFDAWALVAAAVLGTSAYVELWGARLFQQRDLRAPRVLALNQLALLGVVLAYCATRIHSALTGPSLEEKLAHEQPDLMQLLGDTSDPATRDLLLGLSDLYTVLMLSIYGAVMVASVLFQGGCAAYYYTRLSHLRAYLQQTPPWVVRVERRQR